MRLTATQLVEGFGHESMFVRDQVLQYFKHKPDVPIELTRRVIQRIDDHGWGDVAVWPHCINCCLLDEEAMLWVLEQIHKLHEADSGSPLPSHLASWIAAGPIELLRKNHSKLGASSLLRDGFSPNHWSPLALIDERLQIWEQTPEACWDQLVAHCQTVGDVDFLDKANIPYAKRLLEPIASAGDSFADRTMDWFRNKSGTQGGWHDWMSGMMLTLAGQLRLEEAAPYLVQGFEADWDWYSESASDALSNIGTPSIHRYVANQYLGVPWCARLYLSSVLENICCDEAVDSIVSLLEEESDDGLRVNLARAAISQFDDAAIELAESIFEENPEDTERRELISRLFALVSIADIDHPERSAWQETLEQDNKRMLEYLSSDVFKMLLEGVKQEQSELNGEKHRVDSGVKQVPVRKARKQRIGRNDPCPCGSGKKYKKCCLRIDSLI
ncbi:MAG: SEC-C metal-binding domain-containing protein [Pirellulaceae bacterium]